LNPEQIHPGAWVAEGARLGEDIHIGPGAVIGPQVVLADGVRIGPHAVLEGDTRVGANTRIAAHATLGTAPQDLDYGGEDTALVIGADNDIREYVNLSRGTVKGGGRTVLGDGNLLMAYSHVGHDARLGDGCVITNGAQIAGHAEIGDHVVFGGLSGIHQYARVGSLAMVAAGAMVTQDVPPFCMVQGDRAGPVGVNVTGLRRHGGYDPGRVRQLYRLLYRAGLGLEEALARMMVAVSDGPERRLFMDFLRVSRRGICR